MALSVIPGNSPVVKQEQLWHWVSYLAYLAVVKQQLWH